MQVKKVFTFLTEVSNPARTAAIITRATDIVTTITCVTVDTRLRTVLSKISKGARLGYQFSSSQ